VTRGSASTAVTSTIDFIVGCYDTAWTPNDLEAECRSLLASPPLTPADNNAP